MTSLWLIGYSESQIGSGTYTWMADGTEDWPLHYARGERRFGNILWIALIIGGELDGSSASLTCDTDSHVTSL